MLAVRVPTGNTAYTLSKSKENLIKGLLKIEGWAGCWKITIVSAKPLGLSEGETVATRTGNKRAMCSTSYALQIRATTSLNSRERRLWK